MSNSPFVLCGPILRRVDPQTVSVFVAVAQPSTVELRVFSLGDAARGYAPGEVILNGSAPTLRLGEHLHVVTVTATGAGLEPTRLYGYDLAFAGVQHAFSSLLSEGVVAPTREEARRRLGYYHTSADPRGPEFPSFATPTGANHLRLFHASCRKPNGEGIDLLPALDKIIEGAVGEPERRPHQMIFGGDQIYADDVADPFLAMVHGTAQEPGLAQRLGMAREQLPLGHARQRHDDEYKPGLRAPDVREIAKFTSDECDSHLLSFREFAAMYLLAWSDVLWPERIPSFEAMFPAETAVLQDRQGRQEGETVYDLLRSGRPYTANAQQKAIVQRYVRWNEHAIRLDSFRQGLRAVRRALANIPCYMIFDDHEVTDDWNQTKEWVQRAVIDSELGRRIVRNGLAAYVVFQGWGNVPDRYANASEAGRKALEHLEAWLSAPSTTSDEKLRDLLGLPREIKANGHLGRPDGALLYHFHVLWPGYQLIALDTRTFREYPAGAGNPGGLLYSDGPLNEMLRGAEVLDDDAITVVAQPVAFFGVPILEQLAQPLGKAFRGRYYADAEDAWVASEAALHKVLGRLMSLGPADADGVHRRRVVLLGGDIHFASGERLRYSATLPYASGPDPTKPYEGVKRTEGVAANFVSSGLRKEDDKTRLLHHTGYVPLLPVTGRIDLIGYANEEKDKEGQSFQAGVEVALAGDAITGFRLSGRPAVSTWDARHILSRTPEWALYIQFLRHDESDPGVQRNGTVETVENPASLPRAEHLRQYLSAARNLDGYLGQWGNGKEIVGYNNLGEIQFQWPNGPCRSASQTLWWHLPGEKEAAPLTTFKADLSYGCSLLSPPPYGFLLRIGDRDAAASEKARYDGVDRPAEVVTEPWVEALQRDLIELGFAIQNEPNGRFDEDTYWAVREFQTYARKERAARETTQKPAPPRYSDRLEPVEIPPADRYVGAVSGVADVATQLCVKLWKTNRWRCPMVLEAWKMAGESLLALSEPNLWKHDRVTAPDQRVFCRDITADPDGTPTPPEHPELVPLGRYEIRSEAREWSGPVSLASSELLPEHWLPAAPGDTQGPTLQVLVQRIGSPDAELAQTARRQLSTFKVLRAASEAHTATSAGAWFDRLDASTQSLLEVGPFGFRAHGPYPKATSLPDYGNFRVQAGQLWAYVAYLKTYDLDAFEAIGGAAGLTASPGFGKDGAALLEPTLRIPRAQARLTDGADVAADVLDDVFLLREIRSWHWVERIVTALRRDRGVRHGLWGFMRQQLKDLLTVPWDSPDPSLPVSVPDVPGPDGKPRRAQIGDVFTSERAVAELFAWQLYRASDLTGHGSPGLREKEEHRKKIRAAEMLPKVLEVAKRSAPFEGAPNEWKDAEERALIAAMEEVVQDSPSLWAALQAVHQWPAWPTGSGYTLPISDLPETERALLDARNSLQLDRTGLSRGTP